MDERRLARVHRVRNVQVRLAEADELRARDKAASESALHARVAQLAAGVAPAVEERAAVSLAAAAHFRARLQQSEAAAESRARAAALAHARATAATVSARQDRTAIEKLLERAEADTAAAERRALADAPVQRRVRHDPC